MKRQLINDVKARKDLEKPARIGKVRFATIIGSSIISMVVLLYQTIEYLQNSCGCGENIPEIVASFREYGNIGGIPVSLLGFLGMGLVIINVVGISNIPSNYVIPIYNDKKLALDSNRIKNWHLLLLIQLLLMCIAVVNYFYIEMVIIQKICVGCTISQGIIIVNTILVYTWKLED